jgi:hypothetical protein
MAFIGWATTSLTIGELFDHPCRRCCRDSDFSVTMTYGYLHLYKAFGLTLRRQYLAECKRCGKVMKIKKGEFPGLGGNATIPFMQRWGLIVFIVLLVATIALIVEFTVKWSERSGPEEGLLQPQPVSLRCGFAPAPAFPPRVRQAFPIPAKS